MRDAGLALLWRSTRRAPTSNPPGSNAPAHPGQARWRRRLGNIRLVGQKSAFWETLVA